jgi:transcriptional regulator with XRE-family HTH domain
MKNLYKTVGDNISLFRKKNKLTLEELSKKAGISTSFLSNIERGSRKATLHTIDKIADALDKPLSSLIAYRVGEEYLPEDAMLTLNIMQVLTDKSIEEKKKILAILKHL